MSLQNRQRLEFAATGFLAEMRKQWAKMHPQDPCPVKNLIDYPPAERSALMAAVEKSIKFAGTDADATFEAWVRKREAKAQTA
ncbi:hypothetical protein [Agrobacterium sp. CG674]